MIKTFTHSCKRVVKRFVVVMESSLKIFCSWLSVYFLSHLITLWCTNDSCGSKVHFSVACLLFWSILRQVHKLTVVYIHACSHHIAHLRQECHNSKFGIFWLIGIERNVCRCTFNRYRVITNFVKLATGEQVCCCCTHKKG